MIKASTAAQRTARNIRARELVAHRKQQREAVKLKVTQARLVKTEVPFALKKVEEEIKASRERSTTWSFPGTAEYALVVDAFVKALEADGYRCRVRRDKGSDDMGDFNAPCVVYYDNMVVTITW